MGGVITSCELDGSKAGVKAEYQGESDKNVRGNEDIGPVSEVRGSEITVFGRKLSVFILYHTLFQWTQTGWHFCIMIAARMYEIVLSYLFYA